MAKVRRAEWKGVVVDDAACYRAVQSKDRRFDGVFFTAVTSTGIYCRPSCPAITPRHDNVVFFVTAAAAQAAGFRACRRCRPDVAPGSPDWDVRADVAGRTMRLIEDGVVEREGVEGLARRIGYTSRHLGRLLTQELGAGPLALARAHRAHTARILIETTGMSFADIAFAAGFASVRQFNASVRESFALTPSELRRRRPGQAAKVQPGAIELSLAVRQPFDHEGLLRFLRPRAVSGIEIVTEASYARTLRLPRGAGVALLEPTEDRVRCTLWLADLRDLATAVSRCRWLFDLDADPVAVDRHLAADEVLRPWVLKRPGIRVPGHVDGFEAAVRAIVGQQISVAGARTVVTRLVDGYGERLTSGVVSPADQGSATALSHVFPPPEVLAEVDPARLPMPRARARALVALSERVASRDLLLDRGADRKAVREALLAIPGIGPWTAAYIALRALGDPDVFLPSDLGVRAGLRSLGVAERSAEVVKGWQPWRSYALMHVWNSSSKEGL